MAKKKNQVACVKQVTTVLSDEERLKKIEELKENTRKKKLAISKNKLTEIRKDSANKGITPKSDSEENVFVPLNEEECVADLVEKLDAEVILVSNHYLGSINHTLLTAQELKRRNIKVKGKVSGQFRSIRGAERFAILRSIIDTSAKNAQDIFNSLYLIADFVPE